MRFQDAYGPVMTLLGMASLVGCTTKMQYILNRLGVIPSHETVNHIRKRIIVMNKVNDMPALVNVKPRRLAVFSIDNLDMSNRHGQALKGRTLHSLN